jgi:hypothetical protein
LACRVVVLDLAKPPELSDPFLSGEAANGRLALARVPLVATLGLELGILAEKPQALEVAGAISMRMSF